MDLNADPYKPNPPRRQPPIPWTPAQKKAVKEGLAWVIGAAVTVGGIILVGKSMKKPRRRR